MSWTLGGHQGEKSHAYAPGLMRMASKGLQRPVTNQGSWPPQSVKTDQQPDRKFRQGFMGPLLHRGEWKHVTGLFAHSLTRVSWFLIQGESRGGPKGRAGGVT